MRRWNEKSANARYREFTQADGDIIGNTNKSQADAEISNIIADTLTKCGLSEKQFTVSISNRKIVQGLINQLNITDKIQELKVIRAIDKLDRVGLKGDEDLLKKEREHAELWIKLSELESLTFNPIPIIKCSPLFSIEIPPTFLESYNISFGIINKTKLIWAHYYQ